MSLPLSAPTTSRNRSRVTNGKALLSGVDGRSPLARRYRDIVDALSAEHGGAITQALLLRIRTVAALQLHAEDLTARVARGEMISAEDMSRAGNGAIRALAKLRAEAHRRQPKRPLADYLARKAGEAVT